MPSSRRYDVQLTPAALRDLEGVPRDVQTRLINRIEALAEDPRPHGVKKLSGESELYRLREGDFRIVYEIRDEVLVVIVISVGDRKDIYRRGLE